MTSALRSASSAARGSSMNSTRGWRPGRARSPRAGARPRQRMGAPPEQVSDAQQFHCLLQRNLPPRGGRAPQAVIQVAAHVQVGEEARLLEDVAKSAPVRRQPPAECVVLPDVSRHRHAAGTALQPRHGAQQAGLAASGRAGHRGDAPSRKAQVRFQREAPGPRQAQPHLDGIARGQAGGRHARLRAGCRACSASSTVNEKATMAPASQWAWAYSSASTWS